MTTLYPIELPGLRGHHPLGFLAACGLVRLAAECYPTRLGWKTKTAGGWIAFLQIGEAEADGLRDRLTNIVAEAAEKFIKNLERVRITEAEVPASDFRKWSESTLATDLLPSIGSEILQRRKESGKNKGKFVIRMTHFAMTSGQQDLISGARKIAEKLAKRSRNNQIQEDVRQKIQEALFGPWSYQDDEHSLGWDPNSQRLHALRNKAPKDDDKNRSVSGAVFLATQALPLFPCFAVGRNLYTTGFHRDDGEDWFSWPIWRDPISLDVLRSLLVQPFTADLQRRGVELVYRCRRVRTGGAEGNYQVFSHAQQRPWPRV
jgi:hypothetical protein